MPIYREKTDKLNFTIHDNGNPVTIKVDCFYGTVAKVSFINPPVIVFPPRSLGCGETKDIGNYQILKDKSVVFKGGANNPGKEAGEDQQISILHTVSQEGGQTLVYNFPDDYTGHPAFDTRDQHPDFEFNINFH